MSPSGFGAIDHRADCNDEWFGCGVTIDMGGDGELRTRLESLRLEHRDLDDAIQALGQGIQADQMQLARLKRRKLRLRDEIAAVEDELVPDIIA